MALQRLLERKFVLRSDSRLVLNSGKGFLCNYILFYRDRIDQRDFVLLDEYFPTLLSVHGVTTYEQVRGYARNSPGFWVIDCVCRLLYQKCHHPLKICMGMQENYPLEGAQRVSYSEVLDIVGQAEAENLVPAYIAITDGVGWFCFCCGCCCAPINRFLRTGGGLNPSAYIESTDSDICTACGDCVPACQFGARAIRDDELMVDSVKCRGGGVCLDDCPNEAVTLSLR